MKKILAIAIVAVLTVALCVTALANEQSGYQEAVQAAWEHINHVSYDEVRPGIICGANAANIDTPTVEAGTTEVVFWGWIASSSEIKGFSYILDGAAAVTDAAFKYETEDAVKAAGAPAMQGSSGEATVESSRFYVAVPVTDGSHSVKVIANLAAGDEVIWDASLTVGDASAEAPVEVKSDDQWLCGSEPDASQTPSWWFNPLCNAADDSGRYITVNFIADGYFSGIDAFCYCNPAENGSASTKVELIQSGSVVASGEIKSEGDKLYTVDFGKTFAAGTYSIKFSPLTGSNTENDNWFVLGGFAGSGEDVSVDANVNGPADGIQPSIMLIGSTGSGGGRTNPRTGDAAVIAIAAVAVVALAGVVVAKKVK